MCHEAVETNLADQQRQVEAKLKDTHSTVLRKSYESNIRLLMMCRASEDQVHTKTK